MSNYPGAIDVVTAKTTDDYVLPEHVNEAQNAVVAVETTLGVNPQGEYATVAARLDAVGTGGSGTPANHLHDGSDGTQPLDPTRALLPNSFKPNLLTNSGFRLGAVGWVGVGANGLATPNVLTNRGAEAGLQKTGSNTSGVDQEVVSDPIGINWVGTKLVLSGYISTPNVTAGAFKLRLVVHDVNDVELSGAEVSAANGVTDRYSVALTLPSGAKHVHVKCIVADGTTFTGGGCRFTSLKLEEDSGSGRPSPYSDEADIRYLNTIAGGGSYAPLVHSHDLAAYDGFNDTPGFVTGAERQGIGAVASATSYNTPNTLVMRDGVGEVQVQQVYIESASMPASLNYAISKQHLLQWVGNRNEANDGYYVKFDNGLMLAWGTKDFTGINISTAEGALFTTSLGLYVMLPTPFLAGVQMQYALTDGAYNGALMIFPRAKGDVTGMQRFFSIYNTTAQTNIGFTVAWSAIGNWK